MLLEPAFDAPGRHASDPWMGWRREVTVAEQLEHFVRAAHGAFSPNTERALRSDLGIYAKWCAERGKPGN